MLLGVRPYGVRQSFVLVIALVLFGELCAFVLTACARSTLLKLSTSSTKDISISRGAPAI